MMITTYREARCVLLRLHLGSTAVSVSDSELDLVAEQTQGYSGSDIAHLVTEALLYPVRELSSACQWLPLEGGQKFCPCSPGHPRALSKTFTDLLPEQVPKFQLFFFLFYNPTFFAHIHHIDPFYICNGQKKKRANK